VVVARPGLFLTRDGGVTWSNVTRSLPDRFMMDIAVHPDDEETAYIAVSGFGTAHVFKTENAGLTWQNAGGGLPDVPTNTVAIDPDYPDTVFAGNDLGVFISRDGGTTWTPFNEGLPEAVIAMDLSFSPSNRKLRIATHGTGVYERALFGSPEYTTATETLPAAGFALHPAYPNPFTTRTEITYTLSRAARVRLAVFDAAGRQVAVLEEGVRPLGEHRAAFVAGSLAAGLYLCRIEVEGQVQTRALHLIR
jgi:photosystem II stability/assembly factor-like uncharacterized protein